MNYMIQELAIKYAQALIESHIARIALIDYKGENGNDTLMIKQLEDREYEAWSSLCDVQEQLNRAVKRYVDGS